MMLEQKEVNVMPRSYADLLKEYTKLAKQADQRLVRLESAAKEKGFSNVLNFAYQKAMKSIERWSGGGAKRFNRNTPEKAQSLRAKIADIKQFLGYKSSTKAGIKRTYKQVAKSTNQKYGTDLTWDKLEDLYNSSEWEWMEAQYGSDTAMRAIGQINENQDYLENAIKKHEQVDFQIGNAKVKEAVEASIEKYGLDLVNLY